MSAVPNITLDPVEETPAIAVVAHLPLVPGIAGHRFVLEALAITSAFTHRMPGRALATRNDGTTADCQLYGWDRNVPEHVDDTGWIYFLPLIGEPSVIIAAGMRLTVRNGDVVRLDDSVPHWTRDETQRICLFAGPYPEPADEMAITALSEGLRRLAAGADDAPRVSETDRAWRISVEGCK